MRSGIQCESMGRPQTQYRHLFPNPKSSYRQLFVNGTGVAARTLYGQHVNAEEPRSVEELAADWNIPVEAVEEAIAYCRLNPPEIELDLRREEAIMEATGMNEPGYKYHGKPRLLSPQERGRIKRLYEA